MDQLAFDLEIQEPVQEEFEKSESKSDLKQDPEDDDFFLPATNPPKRHRFQCEICDKILSTKQTLQVHALTHEDPTKRQTFRCEICETTFRSRVGLKYHLKTKHIAEHERQKLPCPTCGRIFKSAEGRKIHMTIQHGAGGPIFKCRECPMVFARKPHLDLHMATHGSGLHVCTICGKSYARLKDLSRHEATCGVKELCCPVCGKQLRTEQALENHRKKCRSKGRNLEPGAGENRGRPKKNYSSGGEEGKVRMRRSKHDLFIGLEHLADPSALVEVAKPAEIEPKPADLPIRQRVPCEHCPRKFASKKAALNHGQRRHWEALGLSGPAPERRGRKRTYPLGHVRKRIRNRRKVVNYVDPAKLPQEVESDAAEEEDDPVKLEDTAHGEATIDDPVEEVAIPELVEQNVVYVEEKHEPIDELKQSAPDNLAAIEEIKQEEIEFGDYEFGYFETDSADDCDPPVDELKIQDVSVELQTPQEPSSAEVDTLAVEPALESNVSEETHVFKELIICLEKLDYSAVVEPSSKKKRLPRMACEHCGQTFAKQYRLAQHRVREHGSTETPTRIKLPPKSTLPPSYHCEECDKSYQVEYKLRDHKERVHGIVTEAGEHREGRRSCKHCGQKLVSWPSLVKHLKAFHGETIDKSQCVRCPSCLALFLTEEELKEHVCRKKMDRVREPREPRARAFKCDLCRKAYTFLLQLEAHYSVHPEYQNCKCDQCSMGFFNERELGKHKRSVHVDPLQEKPKKIRPFKSKYKNPMPRTECEHCGKTFAHRYHLALHRVREHGSTETPVANSAMRATIATLPRNFHCDQCDKSYHLQTNLTIHKAKAHGVGEVPRRESKTGDHTCKHCERKFTWVGLVYHLKFTHGETVDRTQCERCPSCRRKFVTKEEMEKHICLKGIVREKERPFKCDLCDKDYSGKHQLEGHYSAHPEYHNVKCDQCPKGFFNESQLRAHKKKMHKEKEAYIECAICNKLLKNKDIWRRHQELHSDHEYCCEHCGKRFKLQINLRSHLDKWHRGDRMIPCKICGKTLTGRMGIALHMRIHNNDRRYKCSFPPCEKVFLTSGCLKTHEQTHTKDYKYKCKFCSYGAVRPKLLAMHEQRHHSEAGDGNDAKL